LNDLLAQPSAQRDLRAVKTTQADIEKFRAAQSTARRDIGRRFPKYGNLIDPGPVPPGHIQLVLLPDEAVVSYYFGQYDSFVWVVPKQGTVRFLRLPTTLGALESKVAKLREALEPNVDRVGDIPPFDIALAHELYGELLKPTEAVWESAKHLIVMTNGPLGLLPLGLLPTAPTVMPAQTELPFANYRDVPWLARTHAVTIVPSAAALRSLRELPPNPRQRAPLIGFGDPYFSVNQDVTAEPDVAPIADQAPRVEAEAAPEQVAVDTRGPPFKLRPVAQMTGVDSAELAVMPRLPEPGMN